MKVMPFLHLQPNGYVLFRDYATGDLAQVDFVALYLFNSSTGKLKSALLLLNLFFPIIIHKTIVNKNRTKCIGINKINTTVPRWSYKFIDELEQLVGNNEPENIQIRSKKAERVVILTRYL